LFFFTIEYKTGKIFLKDFSFENDNFWVSIEGATENMFLLGRFEKPEIPFQKNIIAIDLTTGQKLWENKKYSYLLNTENLLYGIYRKFESNEIAELDINTGEVKNILTESEHLNILDLRNNSEDIIYENSNYPVIYYKDNADKNIKEVIESFCENSQNIEYIQNGSLLIFNYYIKFETGKEEAGKIFYRNKFVIFDLTKSELLFEDILNKKTSYCVPDNFFIKKEFLFYLKEKTFLNCIKLN
jgi:hypothetical protein